MPGRELVLHHIKAPAGVTVTLLGVPGALPAKLDGDTLTITPPDFGPDAAPCHYAYAFKIAGGRVAAEAAEK